MKTCADCQFVKVIRYTNKMVTLPDSLQCRIRAPRLGERNEAAWPYVKADDWCAEYATRPDKAEG